MGFRFQKRIDVLPGVRANLSKSGVSASLGPRGADVNIGRDGVTTNAGIPGTGLSYRSKMGGPGSKLGILAIIAGLGFWAFQHRDKIEKIIAPHPAAQAVPASSASAENPSAIRYVHRNGSDLRQTESASGAVLQKEPKGTQVTLLATDGDWSQIQDGTLTGWMRTSILGAEPPN
ncbi:MAG TPA: DUF4236 domain-containing protein [Rhizomicrobium sp.]|jgi:hypothetical protein